MLLHIFDRIHILTFVGRNLSLVGLSVRIERTISGASGSNFLHINTSILLVLMSMVSARDRGLDMLGTVIPSSFVDVTLVSGTRMMAWVRNPNVGKCETQNGPSKLSGTSHFFLPS